MILKLEHELENMESLLIHKMFDHTPRVSISPEQGLRVCILVSFWVLLLLLFFCFCFCQGRGENHTLRTTSLAFGGPRLGHQVGGQGVTLGSPSFKMPAEH